MGWDDTSDSCCNEDVSDIIACVCELKRTIECVAECFNGHLSSGTKQKILFCLVLQEIKKVEDILNNKVFGLNEIKNEVRVLENAVLSPIFGLNEIKNEIRGIENTIPNINITVNNINEIVADINDILNNEIFGLNEIKNEIRGIENTIGNLPSINITVNNINEIVAGINDILNNEVFGLNEIKNEIRGIENTIGNLPSINITVNNINEIVAGINDTLNNEIFGLNEIKNEIRSIENNTGLGSVLTTGPVVTDVNSKNLRVKVLNNSQSNQTVTVRVFNLAQCPKCNDIFFQGNLGPIQVGCANEISNISLQDVPEFEVEIAGIVPGVYVWASANTGESTNLVPVNTFSHADFVRQVYNIC